MQKDNFHNQDSASNRYTCNEYREEMILLGLRQKFHNPDLPESEKGYLREEITRLEEKIGF